MRVCRMVDCMPYGSCVQCAHMLRRPEIVCVAVIQIVQFAGLLGVDCTQTAGSTAYILVQQCNGVCCVIHSLAYVLFRSGLGLVLCVSSHMRHIPGPPTVEYELFFYC